MSNLFTERVLNMAAVTPQPEDYTGEDGLLYCGKCHTPKEAYFPEKPLAPGSAGHIKRFDVPDKEAAMIMAIVANKLDTPLNELHFVSIKEVKEDEV